MRSRPAVIGAAVLVAAVAAASRADRNDGAASSEPFVPARPGYAWSFPRDHWSHPGYHTEWWYFTGTLFADGAPGQQFGYQLTFFRIGLAPQRPALDSPWSTANLVMVHAAVSDLRARRHVFSDVLWREMPYLGGFAPPPPEARTGAGAGAGASAAASPAAEAQHPIAWARPPAGSEGRWTLDLVAGAFRLDVDDRARGLAYHLTARPERPIVLQGPGGLSRKSDREGYASLYYSVTRLRTEGTVTMGGTTWNVRGTSWMDREFGSSQLAPDQVGWDWFALRLADGRDLMLYVLRRKDGSIDYAKGTLVEADGRTRWLAGAEFAVRPTATWKSPDTGATYPARWTVEIPSARLRIDVQPAFPDQEDRGGVIEGLFYWEGAVQVRDERGAVAGEGYVELTGYGEKSRPPI